jgi:predicted metal-dependent HD superfamily phosphohydrolase
MIEINFREVENRIASNVTTAYEATDVPHYPYHNLTHSQDVVARCREISLYYSLDQQASFVLVAAGWFHDIGHLSGVIEGHEERGVQKMKECLHDVPPALTDAIAECIMATKLPSHPSSLLEKIICDADTFHLGTLDFRRTDPLVHQEIELRKKVVIPDWAAKTLIMLRRHTFFTDYCQRLLADGKLANIAWVEAQTKNPRSSPGEN